jgi:hypothetical protein
MHDKIDKFRENEFVYLLENWLEFMNNKKKNEFEE